MEDLFSNEECLSVCNKVTPQLVCYKKLLTANYYLISNRDIWNNCIFIKYFKLILLLNWLISKASANACTTKIIMKNIFFLKQCSHLRSKRLFLGPSCTVRLMLVICLARLWVNFHLRGAHYKDKLLYLRWKENRQY